MTNLTRITISLLSIIMLLLISFIILPEAIDKVFSNQDNSNLMYRNNIGYEVVNY